MAQAPIPGVTPSQQSAVKKAIYNHLKENEVFTSLEEEEIALTDGAGASVQLRRRTIDFSATSPPSRNFVCHSFQKRPRPRPSAPAAGRSAPAPRARLSWRAAQVARGGGASHIF